MMFLFTPVREKECPKCHKVIENIQESIEPEDGFIAEEKPRKFKLSDVNSLKEMTTEALYHSELDAEPIARLQFEINGNTVIAESRKNDAVLIKSIHSYYVCDKCGYSIREDEKYLNDKTANKNLSNRPQTLQIKSKHKKPWGSNCDSTELKKYYLHHLIKTDLVKLKFSKIAYSNPRSVAYALLYAMCDVLSIDRKDLSVCLSVEGEKNDLGLWIIIYDNVSGGAGLSTSLVTKDGLILQRIIK